MNELKIIKKTNGVIQTNFKEFHEELKLAIKDYKGLVVTEDNLKEMKSTRLELTKAIKIIDDERKVQKKEFIIPLTKYEEECKMAIETIKEAENELKEKIDVFDEQVRQEKLKYAVQVALELSKSLKLELDYQNRIDVEKSEFTNVTMTKKKILEDITQQVSELEKLQKAKYSNMEYVKNQLVTASKLSGLSTELVIDDISHLIGSYETMDVATVTNGITAVAMRRKEAEELAIKQAEERIRAEEQRKAEAKERAERERILAEERAKERAEREELERLRKLEAEKLEVERLAELEQQQSFETFEEIEEGFVIVDEEPEVLEFVSVEEAEEHEAIKVVRVNCKASETIDIIRLLTLNGYDCEVE